MPAPQPFYVGQHAQVSATENNLPPNSPAPNYSWSVDNPAVAIIGSEGGNGTNARVDGVGAGTTTIHCMDTVNNLAATDTVTITAIPPTISLGWGNPS